MNEFFILFSRNIIRFLVFNFHIMHVKEHCIRTKIYVVYDPDWNCLNDVVIRVEMEIEFRCWSRWFDLPLSLRLICVAIYETTSISFSSSWNIFAPYTNFEPFEEKTSIPNEHISCIFRDFYHKIETLIKCCFQSNGKMRNQIIILWGIVRSNSN